MSVLCERLTDVCSWYFKLLVAWSRSRGSRRVVGVCRGGRSLWSQTAAHQAELARRDEELRRGEDVLVCGVTVDVHGFVRATWC